MVLLSPFHTCPDCGAVLYMGSRCWNCHPPRVMQPEGAAEHQPAFGLPDDYLERLRRGFRL